MEATTVLIITAVAAIVAALTALASVIVGPRMQYRVAKKQIHASVISANRQAWIDTLRNQVATLIEALVAHAERKSKGEPARSTTDLHHLSAQIRLLLDPGESDHVELRTKIKAAFDALAKYATSTAPQSDPSELNTTHDAIIAATHKVLKRERERVERGD